MSDRTIFIGDLHGMLDETVELMKRCEVGPNDRVIWMGDLVDRGPSSAKCIDLVRAREQEQGSPACILGNHEEKHVSYEDCIARTGRLPEKSLPPPHVATREQLKPEHYAWIRTLPHFIRVPEHNIIAVHAGVWPDRPIEAQDPHHLLHLQMIRPFDKDGQPTRNYRSYWPSRVPDNEDGWCFWSVFYNGPETIVFGHSVLDRPLISDKVVGIDGGAVFGRKLHAYIMPEKRVVTVDCTNDFGKGRRGVQNETIKLYRVHGEVHTFS